MPSREQLRNKLRELGFKYKRQAERVEMWKRGTDVAMLPRKDAPDDRAVREILRRAGCGAEEIEAFIRSCKA